MAVAGLVVGAASASASSDEGAVPTTTVAPTSTTVLGSPAPTSTVAAVPAPPRAGSAIGDLDKPDAGELWSTRQLATVIAVGVGGLAVIGYAYGRIRSYGT